MPILVTCECGKQFQAKDENIGRRFNCPNCDREVVVPKPEAEASYYEPPVHGVVPVRTSGQAIASLILGILSLLGCLFFTGLPAVILGGLGLSNIGKSNRRLEGKGMAIAGIVTGGLGILASVLLVPITIALMLPAVQSAREAARRAQCVNNLKQIALALHNYEDAYGHLPPAFSTDSTGKPLLSWRVAILPYLQQQPLYAQFKLDEPWDGPNNSKLMDQMPDPFRCPSDADLPASTTTHYLAITGPGSAFEGPDGQPIKAITDGTSNTLMVVEAKAPVSWTKPDDVPIGEVPAALGSNHPGGSNAAMGDGSVRFLKVTTPPAVIKALSTRAGGEVLAPGSF